MPPFSDQLSKWYERELKPHEAMLRAWLRSRYKIEHEADDIVQDAVVKVMEVQETRELESPKAYLFATARNAALMRLRKIQVRRQVSLADFEDMDVFADETLDVAQAAIKGEELEMLTRAVQSLPTRCRQVITLRKIYGMSQRQIAEQLGITENTVESQIAIGTRKIGEYFDRNEIR
jgi:RNA polymerase sigma factor (sigma-70 family)